MDNTINKITGFVKGVVDRYRFLEKNQPSSDISNKTNMQIVVALAFLILSITNFLSASYVMLALTLVGCIANSVSVILSKKYKNGYICSTTSIVTCSLLFAFFIIYGGNDGFASLWVVLLPFLSMFVMDFVFGFFTGIFFQLFLIVIFWTPVRDMIFYRYNDQFCLRFPLFFLVTFLLGLSLTISMQKSKYNEYRHLIEMENMTDAAHHLARIDPLTELANRRCAYEEFKTHFADEGCPHCIVMGDIDHFKIVNDTFGHEFGDEVLITFAQYLNKLLPPDYLKSRWGGEEFLIAANAPLNEVYTLIENLRKAMAKHEFICNGKSVHVTITFGIAEYNGIQDIDKAVIDADNRLYKGKTASRNCTVTED